MKIISSNVHTSLELLSIHSALTMSKCNSNNVKFYKNQHNNNATIIEKVSCVASEPSLKFLQLVSIFESEESDIKFKCEL